MASKKKTKILKNFKNKYITIVCKDIKTKEGNTAFSGFLIDEDDENYYLGAEEDVIAACISKNQCAAITTSDPLEILMNQIDIPEDQGVQ